MKLRKATQITLLFLFALVLVFSSCRKDDDFATDPSSKINFSTDSIAFDTVFTTVGSTTKQLKVYNRNNKSIKFDVILDGGNASNFRINVDGSAGTSFKEIEIASNDSLFIFIKVTVDPTNQNSPLVITDELVFNSNGNTSNVDLVAWGQDAYYIIADTYIDGLPPYKIVAHENSDTTWDSQKPYLIYGYAVVDSTAILRISAGAKIHFHNNSGLWVYKGAALKVNGTLEEPVIFQGDRLDMDYQDIPGQWDRIWINEGSVDNEINYAIIRNGFIGLQTETLQENMGNQLKITNTIIENMTGMGIFSRYYQIEAENLVIDNCGSYGLALTLGGDYNFKQCTFGNYWSSSIRQTPNLFFNNFYLDADDIAQAFDFNAYFGNCINYGRNAEEFDFESDAGGSFTYMFDHCLLKTERDISDQIRYNDCFKNEDPLFKDYQNFNFELDTLSPAIDKGNIDIANEIPFDILNNSRTDSPDLGAYEFIPGL
jgi:hypothetical protein